MRPITLRKTLPFLAFATGFLLHGCASGPQLGTLGAFASGDRITITNSAPGPIEKMMVQGEVYAAGGWWRIPKGPIPDIPGNDSIATDKFPGEVTAFDLKFTAPSGKARLRWHGATNGEKKTVRIWPDFPHGQPVYITEPSDGANTHE